MNGQTTAMTDAAIAADLRQALDVQSNFTAEVALDAIYFRAPPINLVSAYASGFRK